MDAVETPAGQRPPFEVLEHTADAGIVAHGSSLTDLFTSAALGLFSLMADLAGVDESEHRDIQVRGHDIETLLVRWLTELLYYVDAEEMLFSRFEITHLTETSLRARAYGEPIDRERHDLGLGVKAVTRHMLEIAPENGGYRARILFDI
jgi:SHS2 domain-containing protein